MGSSSAILASGKVWLSLKSMRLAVRLYCPPCRRLGQFLAKCPTCHDSVPLISDSRHLEGLACMTWTGVSREPARTISILNMTRL